MDKQRRIIEIDSDLYEDCKRLGVMGTITARAIADSKPYVEPTGDLISREQVIEDFKQALDFGSATAYIRKLNELEKTDLVKLVLNVIGNAPTVQDVSVIEFKEPLPLVKAQRIVKTLSKGVCDKCKFNRSEICDTCSRKYSDNFSSN